MSSTLDAKRARLLRVLSAPDPTPVQRLQAALDALSRIEQATRTPGTPMPRASREDLGSSIAAVWAVLNALPRSE